MQVTQKTKLLFPQISIFKFILYSNEIGIKMLKSKLSSQNAIVDFTLLDIRWEALWKKALLYKHAKAIELPAILWQWELYAIDSFVMDRCVSPCPFENDSGIRQRIRSHRPYCKFSFSNQKDPVRLCRFEICIGHACMM